MIIEIAVFWIFVIECWFALWVGKTSAKLERICEVIDDFGEGLDSLDEEIREGRRDNARNIIKLEKHLGIQKQFPLQEKDFTYIKTK